MSADQDIARAERAKSILEDELVKEAFSEIESSLQREWRSSNPRDTEGREEVWHLLKALDMMRNYFTIVVEGGTIARARLEQDKRDQATRQPSGAV